MEIQVMANILDKNDQIAAEVNAMLSARGIFVLNLLGSPGSGKTSLLERTLQALQGEVRMAVERAGTKAGNKGFDSAVAAIEMANLLKSI